MRLFLAIELPQNIRDGLAGVQAVLRAKLPEHANWVRPEQFHVTLRFVGDCNEAQAENLIEDLKGRLLPPPLSLTLLEPIPMPAHRGGRPVAVSVWEGTGDLNWIHTICHDAARAIAVGDEEKPFVPHVTLARVRPIQRVTSLEIDKYVDGRWAEMNFIADSITLFRSDLSPGGSSYHPLGRLTLPAVGRPTRGQWLPTV
jgi:2'-5' RNA ligase